MKLGHGNGFGIGPGDTQHGTCSVGKQAKNTYAASVLRISVREAFGATSISRKVFESALFIKRTMEDLLEL